MSTYARDGDPHEPLDAVLRAASVPGHPEELAGLAAAMAAFRSATPGRGRRSVLARVLTVKVLVVGAVAASTGVVLATAGGVLPVPRPEPTPPSDPPAVTDSASVPAVPPPGGPASPTGQPDDPAKHTVGPRQSAGPPCAPCGHEPSKKREPGKPARGGPHSGAPSTPPPPGEPPPAGPLSGAPPPPAGPLPGAPPPPGGETSRAETPGSPAQGAVIAVPPSGAEPPSQGG